MRPRATAGAASAGGRHRRHAVACPPSRSRRVGEVARMSAGATDEAYPHLFSPLELRGHVLRNRIVSTPHATGWLVGAGRLTGSEVDYQIRKAAGGCGLVMTFGSA